MSEASVIMANHQSTQKLWQRVLLQALRDAASRQQRLRPDESLAQASAIRWLNDAGSDFREVCHLAGFAPEVVSDWWISAKADPDKMIAAEKWLNDNHTRQPNQPNKEVEDC